MVALHKVRAVALTGYEDVARVAGLDPALMLERHGISRESLIDPEERIPATSAAELLDEASQCLRLLSGRNHRVHTGICLVTPKEAFRQRLIETRVRFKRLSEDDIQAYIGSGEWRGKAGGYAVQGIAGTFVVKMVGSYTNVVGLPLYESMTLLGGEGFPIRFGWLNAS